MTKMHEHIRCIEKDSLQQILKLKDAIRQRITIGWLPKEHRIKLLIKTKSQVCDPLIHIIEKTSLMIKSNTIIY